MNIININPKSALPKYKQIVLSIDTAISEKQLKINEKLPSINKVCLAFSVSRDTVLLAYNELKKRGVIYAILGKGYYVKSIEFSFEKRYFLLFDELNIFKEDIYNSFLETIKNKAHVEIFFHHFNVNMFKKLVNESNGNYSKYIIMPCNLVGISNSIKSLPANDVYILDQTNEDLTNYPSVHQNFAKDIYEGINIGHQKLQNYQMLVLIFPGLKEPIGMVEGFEKFCKEYQFDYQIISKFDHRAIIQGEVYIIIDDRHLVEVIEQSKNQDLVLGKDFGIISYNETPLKKVVANGITTISTDFRKMGKLLAKMTLSNSKVNIENKSKLIIRNSL